MARARRVYTRAQVRAAFVAAFVQTTGIGAGVYTPSEIDHEVDLLMRAGFHDYAHDRYQLLVVDGSWIPSEARRFLQELTRIWKESR